MGCWDIFCPLCGAPMNCLIENSDTLTPEFKSIFKWLLKCVFLCADGRIIHNVKETACNITFTDKNGNDYSQDLNHSYFDEKKNCGFGMHEDCWTYVKNKYNNKLNFGKIMYHVNKLKHIDFALSGDSSDPKRFIHSASIKKQYGGIGKYWVQDFMMETMINDNNTYMCVSPLNKMKSYISMAKKNTIRINKACSLFKLNKQKDRPSPAISATFFDDGVYKIGDDHNIWITNGGKWKKCQTVVTNITVNIDTFQKPKLYKQIIKILRLPQICEYSDNPKFIKINSIINKKKANISIIHLSPNYIP